MAEVEQCVDPMEVAQRRNVNTDEPQVPECRLESSNSFNVHVESVKGGSDTGGQA